MKIYLLFTQVWAAGSCSSIHSSIPHRSEGTALNGACIFLAEGKEKWPKHVMTLKTLPWTWFTFFWSHFMGQRSSPGQTWNSQPHPQVAHQSRRLGTEPQAWYRAPAGKGVEGKLGCCDVLRLILRILGFIVRSILIDMFGEFCCGNDFFFFFFFFGFVYGAL